MAYQAGGATDPQDLFNKLKVFAATVGWNTVDEDATGAIGAKLVLENGGYNVILWWSSTDTNSIGMRGVMLYDSGLTIDSQAGVSKHAYSNVMAGPYIGYEFYGDTNYIHIVIEVQPNAFSFLCFGRVDKQGDYAGGEYYTNTYWHKSNGKCTYPYTVAFDCDNPTSPGSASPAPQGCFRAELDNQDDWTQFTVYDYVPQTRGGFGSNALAKLLVDSSFNAFNGQTPLFPLYTFRNRPGGRSIVGHPYDIRMVHMGAYLPKQEIIINPDVWRVYPSTVVSSGVRQGHFAYALRKF